MLRTLLSFVLAFAAGLGGGAAACAQPARDVFLVGALQGLHGTEPDFTFEDLRQVIDAVRPEVLVLEVRPDELADRKETPGRPEYPAVVWPWLAANPTAAVAMEPGGEAFAAMTGAAGARFGAFGREKPEAAAYMASLRRSLSAALQAHWRHPADAHDRITADLVRAQGLAQARLGGEAFETGQAEWDAFMVERARAAIAAHPGRRILVLASYRNLQAFRDGLEGEPRLVDMEAWLRSALPDR